MPRTPSDLLSHECIRRRLASGKLYRWEFEKRGEPMTVDVPGRLTLENDRLMVEAAVEGLGLAFVSDLLGGGASCRQNPAGRAGRLDAAVPRPAPLLSAPPAHDGRA